MRIFSWLLLSGCTARVPVSSDPPAEGTSEVENAVPESAPEPALGDRIVIESQPGDRTPESYQLPATLVLPEGEAGSAPCVVFIAGSGPTTRDWLSYGFPGSDTNGSGQQLAEALYANGVGSIRYDKAALPENTWPASETTLDLYRDEAMLAWRSLTDHPVCGRVSILGNSEGSVHAFRAGVLLQDEPRFGGIVSLSGPSKTLLHLVKDQLKAKLPAGTDLDAVDLQLDDLDTRIRRLPEMDEPPLLSLVPEAAGVWMSLLDPIQGELIRDLLLMEPQTFHRAYRGPALVMVADHDIQVPPSEGEAIFAALAPSESPRYFVEITDANHVFKYEPRVRGEVEDLVLVMAYFKDGLPLAEGLVSRIQDFLFEQEGDQELP